MEGTSSDLDTTGCDCKSVTAAGTPKDNGKNCRGFLGSDCSDRPTEKASAEWKARSDCRGRSETTLWKRATATAKAGQKGTAGVFVEAAAEATRDRGT